MLVVSRNVEDSVIMLDGMIDVKVIGIRGNTVRLGITAPKEISIDRKEVFKKKVLAGTIKPRGL